MSNEKIELRKQLKQLFPNEEYEVALSLLTLMNELIKRKPENGLSWSFGPDESKVEIVVKHYTGQSPTDKLIEALERIDELERLVESHKVALDQIWFQR